MAEGGLLLSEYPHAVTPRGFRFPERNRLISGVSMIVVVVEASRKSGSLITARLAGEQGRDVLACPGPPASALSDGCHELIRNGAGLVTRAEHVLEELGLEAPPRAGEPELSGAGRQIYAVLDGTPRSAEEIAVAADLPFADVIGELIDLELNGIVRQQSLGYIRTSSKQLE